MKKIIVGGGRDFNDFKLLSYVLDTEIPCKGRKDYEIVSGGAMGADRLGEKHALQYGMKLTIFPANWKKYGKGAGPIRNRQMADYADGLVCFWNGISRGTENMIDLAMKRDMSLRIVQY